MKLYLPVEPTAIGERAGRFRSVKIGNLSCRQPEQFGTPTLRILDDRSTLAINARPEFHSG